MPRRGGNPPVPVLERRRAGVGMDECKKMARNEFGARRKALDPALRMRGGETIRRLITGLPEYRAARHISLYASDGLEPELRPLLGDRSKCFWFPRYDAAERAYCFARVDAPGELTAGKYGLPEPPAAAERAPESVRRREMLHLVPGVAYDGRGTRLGRGGGFYDRLLADVTSPVCGVFFACQKAAELPRAAHDRPLDMAVTELGVERFVRADGAGYDGKSARPGGPGGAQVERNTDK